PDKLREEKEHLLEVLSYALSIGPCISTHHQIFTHGHTEIEPSSFGDKGDPPPDPLISRETKDILPFKENRSGLCPHKARNRLEECRLSCTIRAHQRGEGTHTHVEAHTPEHL